MSKYRLAVFASGRGSNLEALIAAFPPDGSDPAAKVALVVSDNHRAPALAIATKHGIPTLIEPFNPRQMFETYVRQMLNEHSIDLVCLAGFMRILSAPFTRIYGYRILNIHPSLLPKYRGLNPQARALAAGETETGATVHFVDPGIDTGEIVMQRAVPILPDDTEETLTARILAAEHELYPAAVRQVLAGLA